MARDPQDFITCYRCGGDGEIQEDEYGEGMVECDICEGTGEIHPDDDDREDDPDFKRDQECDMN